MKCLDCGIDLITDDKSDDYCAECIFDAPKLVLTPSEIEHLRAVLFVYQSLPYNKNVKNEQTSAINNILDKLGAIRSV